MQQPEEQFIKVGQIEIRFFVDGSHSSGAFDAFEFMVPPAAKVPTAHFHDAVDEFLFGIDGCLTPLAHLTPERLVIKDQDQARERPHHEVLRQLRHAPDRHVISGFEQYLQPDREAIGVEHFPFAWPLVGKEILVERGHDLFCGGQRDDLASVLDADMPHQRRERLGWQLAHRAHEIGRLDEPGQQRRRTGPPRQSGLHVIPRFALRSAV